MDDNHRAPRVMPLPINAVTSFQLVNLAVLLTWTVAFLVRADDIHQRPEFETLWRILPRVWWWAFVTYAIFVINLLPILPFWVKRVNRTFRTKYVGLTLSAVWWVFLSIMFLMLTGLDVGFFLHLILALGALFEVARLARRPI